MHLNPIAGSLAGRAAGPAARAARRTLAPRAGSPASHLLTACTPIRGAAMRRLTASPGKESQS